MNHNLIKTEAKKVIHHHEQARKYADGVKNLLTRFLEEVVVDHDVKILIVPDKPYLIQVTVVLFDYKEAIAVSDMLREIFTGVIMWHDIMKEDDIFTVTYKLYPNDPKRGF